MDATFISSSTTIKAGRPDLIRHWSMKAHRVVLHTILLLLVVGAVESFAQGLGISESPITPDASAILELRSTSRGFLLPRLTTGDISSPVQGLMIYNTGTNNLGFYDGSAWRISGTVTSFSAGTLSPLFTTSVATATTTPALSFSLSNAGAYSILGNNTGGSATPTYFTPTLASALFSNQGTTATVLHGNAAGNPSWGAVSLTADVSGTLPVANGGTGATTLTSNRVLYGNGTSAVGATSAGSQGQYLMSNAGSSAPSWSQPGPASTTVLTSTSSSTYTVPSGITAIIVEMVGGGGGGGGVAKLASTAGGGGGSGAYLRKLITGVTGGVTQYTYQVGTGGSGGAAGANDGSAGGSTTFSTLTAPGGSGGKGMAASGTWRLTSGGRGGTTPTGGDVNVGGAPGGNGLGGESTAWIGPGCGGDSFLGAGAFAPGNTQGNGAAATEYGGGGAGGADSNVANRSGGNGYQGVIIVREYK